LKTYKTFKEECKRDTEILEDLMRDMPMSDDELQSLFEKKTGSKFAKAMKAIAVAMVGRANGQARKVISAKTTDQKLDELAKLVSITGGISAIGVAISDGGRSGISKIIGLTAIKN
jgi:hypothetical protein